MLENKSLSLNMNLEHPQYKNLFAALAPKKTTNPHALSWPEKAVFFPKKKVLTPPYLKDKKKRGQGQYVAVPTGGLRSQDTPPKRNIKKQIHQRYKL